MPLLRKSLYVYGFLTLVTWSDDAERYVDMIFIHTSSFRHHAMGGCADTKTYLRDDTVQKSYRLRCGVVPVSYRTTSTVSHLFTWTPLGTHLYLGGQSTAAGVVMAAAAATLSTEHAGYEQLCSCWWPSTDWCAGTVTIAIGLIFIRIIGIQWMNCKRYVDGWVLCVYNERKLFCLRLTV